MNSDDKKELREIASLIGTISGLSLASVGVAATIALILEAGL